VPFGPQPEALEVVAGRQSRLTSADHQYVEVGRHSW
jgi:hypothetical protein